MFRLLKLCVGLAGFVAFAWFGATVNLGSRTLFGHLHAIGQTRESQELMDGTRRAAEPLVNDVRRRIAGAPGSSEEAARPPPALSPDAGAPQETVSAADRRQLRRILGSPEQATARR